MTTDADVRHEYYVARGYLHALQVCFDRLDHQGAGPAVTHALRIRTQDLAAELERVVMAGDTAAPSAMCLPEMSSIEVSLRVGTR